MPKNYLLLCALKPEWGKLKKLIRENAGHLHLCQTGIGMERAQRCVAALMANPNSRFDCVIHFGLAGALKAGLRSGDLFLPNGIVGTEGAEISTATEVLSRARAVLNSLELPYWEGRLLTSDQVLSTPERKQKAGEKYAADIVDMETYPVSRIFSSIPIPFLPIRAIFDPVDWDLTALEASLHPDGNLNASGLLREVVRRPKLLLKLPRYQAALSRANRAIARFISAFIKQDNA